MDNFNTNPFPYGAPPTMPVATEEENTPATVKKNVASRIFAGLLTALVVAFVFLCKINVIVGTGAKEMTLFTAVKELFGSAPSSIFGLPALAWTEVYGEAFLLGQCTALFFYLLLACIAVVTVLGIIAIFCGKCAPRLLKVSALCLAFGFLGYTANVFAYTYTTSPAGVIDLFTLALGGVGALVYVVTAFAKNGKTAVANFVQLFLSFAACACVIYALIRYTYEYYVGVGSLDFDLICTIITATMLFVLITGAIRLQTKKGVAFDFVRYLLQLAVTAFTVYVALKAKAESKVFLIISVVAVVITLAQIVIAVLQKKASSLSEEAEEEEEEIAPTPAPAPFAFATPAVESNPEFVVEEYAEATPYEGGPVEGVEVAKEVNPTYIQQPTHVQTAGYDFYNCKSFDPFIAILDMEERNQFTELFILKYKGVMPEIPDYQVGGDNKEFFRKLFIYLGQYRDRIPDSLLAKIYQFAIKMS